jgi:hypothetical protein
MYTIVLGSQMGRYQHTKDLPHIINIGQSFASSVRGLLQSHKFLPKSPVPQLNAKANQHHNFVFIDLLMQIQLVNEPSKVQADDRIIFLAACCHFFPNNVQKYLM